MRPILFVAAHEWKVKESVGADVLGGPQPRSNEIALWGGCGRPRTSAPTGGDAPRRFCGQMRENEAIRKAWKRVHEQRD